MSIRVNQTTSLRIIAGFTASIMLLVTGIIVPVYAQDTAQVTATVTVQNISVSVDDGTVAYGILALNTSAGTNGTDTQTATNDGNVTVQFNISGTNSAAWTLGGTPGNNIYTHSFCTATCATPPTNYTALTTNYSTLNASVAPLGTQTFDLHITTPTSTATYTAQNVDVTVQATL